MRKKRGTCPGQEARYPQLENISSNESKMYRRREKLRAPKAKGKQRETRELKIKELAKMSLGST